MPQPTLQLPAGCPLHLRVRVAPLTPEAFAPFGTVIFCPLRPSSASLSGPAARTADANNDVDSTTQNNNVDVDSASQFSSPAPILANQGTALKYSSISPLQDNYPDRRGEPQMSLFACFPRALRRVRISSSPPDDVSPLLAAEGGEVENRGERETDDELRNQGGKEEEEEIEVDAFDIRVLERHPFTTQTFIPLGMEAGSGTGGEGEETGKGETGFLVLVAPTLDGVTSAQDGLCIHELIQNPPDIPNLRAFLARRDQAITYSPGTWHAPMVVLGRRRIDFVVVQYVSGVEDEDCQEVNIPDGFTAVFGIGS